jgi:hypothetical protein
VLVIFRLPTLHYLCTHNKNTNQLMIRSLYQKSAWITLLFVTFIVAGCKKDDKKEEDTATPVSPKLSATIDGSPFNATVVELGEEDGIYTLSGIAAGDKTLTLVFNSTAEGTYTLDFGDVSMLYSVGAVTWTAGPSANGTITITDNANGKLKGTFQANLDELIFTGTTVNVTSGSFEGIAY